jgi:hypothetical protein
VSYASVLRAEHVTSIVPTRITIGVEPDTIVALVRLAMIPLILDDGLWDTTRKRLASRLVPVDGTHEMPTVDTDRRTF